MGRIEIAPEDHGKPDALDKAIKRAQSKWQPIETAPKDGTRVLCGSWYERDDDDWQWGDCIAFWVESWWAVGPTWTDGFTSVAPTHWMPLPEPPAATKN